MSDFNINNAIEDYNVIAKNYRDGWINKEQAQKRIDELNTTCEKAGVTFKADFKSLELHVKDEDSSYDDESFSYDDSGYISGADSY